MQLCECHGRLKSEKVKFNIVDNYIQDLLDGYSL